jgi:hypothetical protein
MSEEKTDNGAAEESAETAAPAEEKSTNRSPSNPLSRPTDTTLRPGFRNPSNSRSKVQRKSRKKKRR